MHNVMSSAFVHMTIGFGESFLSGKHCVICLVFKGLPSIPLYVQ